MTHSPLTEFLAHEVDDHSQAELLVAAGHLTVGQRYFTYNTFNVQLDGDASTATIEDELDATRSSTLAWRSSRTCYALARPREMPALPTLPVDSAHGDGSLKRRAVV